MPRTGRFGRLPRQAPDLSSQIAALLREMQSQEDQNIIDAWRNGGEVNGKPVNDARLLAHFKGRRDALSKDDPLWDEWDNRLTQYQFAIEESKMSLKWDQHKVSEREMAAFYKKWAGKATKNSEFRRTLESSAAKWLTASKQRAASGSAGSSADAHYAWAERYYRRNVEPGETAAMALVGLAKQYDAMPMSGTSLADLDPDSAGYGAFMDIYIDGKTNDEFVQNLIDDVTRQIRKTDPGFEFDKRHIDELFRRADDGLGTLVRRSVYKTEREDWQERRGDMRQTQNHIEQAPTIKRIFDAEDLFYEELSNCKGDPYCGLNAAEKFNRVLKNQGMKLMRGGMQDVNIDITRAVASTTRVLDAALSGEPLDPTKAEGTLSTIVELRSEGETNGMAPLAVLMDGIASGAAAIDAGGWTSFEPTDADGNLVFDDMGNPVYSIRVHAPGELPPADLTMVVVPDGLDGGPAGVRSFVEAVPVSVQPVGPTGDPIDPANVTPTFRDSAGNVKQVDPGSLAVYHELPGVVGPDGVARTMYRTGNGTVEEPYLFHTLAPTVADADGNPLTRVGDPGRSGAAVYTVPVTVEGEGEGQRLTADVTPYVNAGKAQRTQLGSGAYPLGTYQTPEGAMVQQVIDHMWDTEMPDANKQSVGYLRQMAQLADELALTNPALGALMRADFEQATKNNVARSQGLSGASYDDWHNTTNMYDERKQVLAEELTRAGFTSDRYGQSAVDERITMLEKLDQWQVERPFKELGEDMASWARYGVVPEREGQSVAERAASTRNKITDPNVSSTDIKLPGVTMPGSPDLFTSVLDWINGRTTKVPSPAMQARKSYPMDTRPADMSNVVAQPPGSQAGWRGGQDSQAQRTTAVAPMVRYPISKPPKPDKPKATKNPRPATSSADFSDLRARLAKYINASDMFVHTMETEDRVERGPQGVGYRPI